jgi:hypothetical protein
MKKLYLWVVCDLYIRFGWAWAHDRAMSMFRKEHSKMGQVS